ELLAQSIEPGPHQRIEPQAGAQRGARALALHVDAELQAFETLPMRRRRRGDRRSYGRFALALELGGILLRELRPLLEVEIHELFPHYRLVARAHPPEPAISAPSSRLQRLQDLAGS